MALPAPPNEIDRRNHVGLRHTLVDCIRSRFAHSGLAKIFFYSLCRGFDFRIWNMLSGEGLRSNRSSCSRCLLRDLGARAAPGLGNGEAGLRLAVECRAPGMGLWLGSETGNYKCLR